MSIQEFWNRLTSRTVVYNLAGMVLVSILLLIGLWWWMGVYTQHGQRVEVPNVENQLVSDADYALSKLGLVAVVTDSSYNRSLPPGTVLAQNPVGGKVVKSGREIYLTVNAAESPTGVIPDIADNCSLREAEAKLKALGFKLGTTEYVPGDKDWVLGVKSRGHNVYAGDKVPLDIPLTLVVGNSDIQADDSLQDDDDLFGGVTDEGDEGDWEEEEF